MPGQSAARLYFLVYHVWAGMYTEMWKNQRLLSQAGDKNLQKKEIIV